MGQLVKGRWLSGEEQPTDAQGEYVRADSKFRHWVTEDGASGFPVEAGRYHLYLAHACPWAHRTYIARALLGLEQAISISIVHPLMLEDGWVFREESGLIPDPIMAARTLWQVYVAADPDFSGKVTVPVLWDKQRGTIVSNESRDVLRMLSTVFVPLGHSKRTLSPTSLRKQIDEAIDAIYAPINNGVYRCGFAKTQHAYEHSARELFDALDVWETRLSRQRYMCGDQLTEADICLFTTLFRFDFVYATHFKCNLRRIVDYTNLFGFVRDIYQTPGVAPTCDIERIKTHYYGSHGFINPRRIVPLGFEVDLSRPHGREALSPRMGAE